MTHKPDDDDEVNAQILRDIESADGDDSAARKHLAAGRAIYIADDNTPAC